MGWESPSHWVIIAILVIALFGYKKLPDAARSIGRSLRVFKAEVKGMSEDDKAREAAKEAERDNKSDSAGAAAIAPPASVQPVQQEPMQQEPMQQEPMQQEPMQQQPMQQQPVQQQPVQQQPVQQQPVQQQPVQQQPAQPVGTVVPTPEPVIEPLGRPESVQASNGRVGSAE